MAVIEIEPDDGLMALVEDIDRIGGVLAYVALRAGGEASSPMSHRAAALAGIAEIGRHLGWARLTWDESKLSGWPVSFTTFWGTDDVSRESIIDGYKTAFFFPPYGLQCSSAEAEELFDRITAIVMGASPAECEVLSWSTDWSNYFDGGKEWWGHSTGLFTPQDRIVST